MKKVLLLASVFAVVCANLARADEEEDATAPDDLSLDYPGHPGHPGYPHPGPGYPQPGYPQPGYPQPGYPQPGYPQPSPYPHCYGEQYGWENIRGRWGCYYERAEFSPERNVCVWTAKQEMDSRYCR